MSTQPPNRTPSARPAPAGSGAPGGHPAASAPTPPHTLPLAPAWLLCEACGYSVGGLDPAAHCPECGSSVARSLPERRLGSPWQRAPGARAWAQTLALMARHPARAWDQARMEITRSVALLIVNLCLSAAALTAVLAGGPIFRTPPLAYVMAFFVVGVLVLAALSSVEFVGVRFFGGRRGYRITKRSALVIVAHASFAWLIAGVGLAIVGHVSYRFEGLWNGATAARVGVPGLAIFGALCMVPVIIGMVVFSSMCGLGFYALRYADSQGAADAAQRPRNPRA